MPSQQPGRDTPAGELALAFARAAVRGTFEAAHAMLSRELQAQSGPDDLARAYAVMLSYSSGPPTLIELVQVDDMAGCEVRKPGDIGWAYVAICGNDYSEAVTVIVADEDGRPVIRWPEWGRP